jgi:hypothetical protein
MNCISAATFAALMGLLFWHQAVAPMDETAIAA